MTTLSFPLEPDGGMNWIVFATLENLRANIAIFLEEDLYSMYLLRLPRLVGQKSLVDAILSERPQVIIALGSR